LGFGAAFCAAAGTTMAVDAKSNIPILCLMQSSPIRMVPSSSRIESLNDRVQ
jgi:hypothetical protein